VAPCRGESRQDKWKKPKFSGPYVIVGWGSCHPNQIHGIRWQRPNERYLLRFPDLAEIIKIMAAICQRRFNMALGDSELIGIRGHGQAAALFG